MKRHDIGRARSPLQQLVKNVQQHCQLDRGDDQAEQDCHDFKYFHKKSSYACIYRFKKRVSGRICRYQTSAPPPRAGQ